MQAVFAEAAGWVGGILGIALGLMGAALGTYFPIKNANGRRERAFVIRASLVGWVFVIAFVAGLFLIPTWHRHLLWIPYAILLPVVIRVWNKHQERIRAEEADGVL